MAKRAHLMNQEKMGRNTCGRLKWLLGSGARCFAATSRTILGRSFWLALFFLGWATTAQALISAAERAVLIDLYASTNGASWTYNTNWNGGVGTECSWYGVSAMARRLGTSS